MVSQYKALFEPFSLGGLRLANRIVMAPMTRCASPGGVPEENVAAYYRRRAENDVGLIITEGTWVPHPFAANDENVPNFYGEDALAGWARVVSEVHVAGGKIMPQLWHTGQTIKPSYETVYDKGLGGFETGQVGPSGIFGGLDRPLEKLGDPMTQADIDAVIDAFGTAAESAWRLGFDGVELHGAHGYIIDQFFWEKTNLRTDRYGGGLTERSRFAAEIIVEIRHRVAPDYPIVFRFSQWKAQDFTAKLARTPQELEAIFAPMVDAGVDIFHCSQRRFWEPEFEGSDMNLAGWAKKITSKPTITVGSVSLDLDSHKTLYTGEVARILPGSIGKVAGMLERGDFDLVAVGRALISDPEWGRKVREGRLDELKEFVPSRLKELT